MLQLDGRICDDVDGSLPPSGKMNMPCTWTAQPGLETFQGCVRFRRRFRKPRQVAANERVWLTFDAADYFTTVWLNGEEVGRHEGMFDPFSFPITDRLRDRNELVVEVDAPAMAAGSESGGERMFGDCLHRGGLWGTVAVEIRREAYLKNWRVWSTFANAVPTLHVAGDIVDEWDRPLELYVLLDGHTVIYEKLSGSPPGRPFELSVEVLEAERWQPADWGTPRLYEVRIELIDISNKMDVRARPFGCREISWDGREDSVIINGRRRLLTREDRVTLLEPIVDCRKLEENDVNGRPIRLTLPSMWHRFSSDKSVRREIIRQVHAIVTHLQHHPAIIGWDWQAERHPQVQELHEQLHATITGLDKTRPCVVRWLADDREETASRANDGSHSAHA
jgi:beta-galactosidase/beta-glucuronidase